jgi:hypothetical protein
MRQTKLTSIVCSRLQGAPATIGIPVGADCIREGVDFGKMKAGIQIWILLLVWAISGLANAVEFQSFAPVLHVEPVIETRYEPVTRRVCTAPDGNSTAAGTSLNNAPVNTLPATG